MRGILEAAGIIVWFILLPEPTFGVSNGAAGAERDLRLGLRRFSGGRHAHRLERGDVPPPVRCPAPPGPRPYPPGLRRRGQLQPSGRNPASLHGTLRPERQDNAGSRIVRVPGAGHLVNWEAPEAIAA